MLKDHEIDLSFRSPMIAKHLSQKKSADIVQTLKCLVLRNAHAVALANDDAMSPIGLVNPF